MRAALLSLLLFTAPAAASEREALYGSWGSLAQCAGEPIKPGGTVRAAPFEIGADWLKQGGVWCRLIWGPLERRSEGVFAAAQAHCGEDAVQSYFLTMETKGEALTLRWDFFRANGPLARCVGS